MLGTAQLQPNVILTRKVQLLKTSIWKGSGEGAGPEETGLVFNKENRRRQEVKDTIKTVLRFASTSMVEVLSER